MQSIKHLKIISRRLACLALALVLALTLAGCGQITSQDGPTQYVSTVLSSNADSTNLPEQDGYYYDLTNVVLYLEAYGQLPPNYITKAEARQLGWQGGTPEQFLEGAAIGGDRFGNREGLLPDNPAGYTECDLNTLGADSRGAERLVFSSSSSTNTDRLYYYTGDHYESFCQVVVEDGQVLTESDI